MTGSSGSLHDLADKALRLAAVAVPDASWPDEQIIVTVVELLRTHSHAREDDVNAFIDAIAFNWLIAGPDAHAKNYSLLIGGGPRVRLAPLYDIASILPYDDIDPHKVKLSMKIGGEYRLRDIGLSEWQKLAREVRMDADALIDRIAAMAGQLPDELSTVCARARGEGLDQPIIERLAGRIAERARACGKTVT